MAFLFYLFFKKEKKKKKENRLKSFATSASIELQYPSPHHTSA